MNNIKRAKKIFAKSDLLRKSNFFFVGMLVMMLCVFFALPPINLIFLIIEYVLGAIGVFYAQRAYKD